MKIFGREPALWLALIAVTVKLIAAFGVNVSGDQQAVINTVAAAAVGILVAATTHDGLGAAVLNFVQAGIAAAVGFGLDWSADRQAVVMSAAAAIVAMWTRTQVTAPVPPVSRPVITAAPPVKGA
ncbi:hypothetical protein [Streptomyces sp. NRRL F-5123]|uniref:hypothetical protein n=1 Tax=Streptomyces sp. NRRL F-5123 TaxID=1463856 RepID=UPI0006935E68|nr:hypothetical protein [Streptomyces sp. NRRL F-5123]